MVFSAYSQHEISRINRSLQRVGMIGSGMIGSAMKWALEDADNLTRWDNRITVVDQFSYFRGIPYDPAWGEDPRRIHVIDEQKLMRLVHVRM